MRSAVCVLLSFAAACSEVEPVVELRGLALGTFYSVKFVGLDADRAAAARAVAATLDEVDRSFSTYRHDSVISRFNAWRQSEWFDVGEEVAGLLARALEIARATDGAFDPAIGAVTRLHPLPGRAESPPGDDEIASALAASGWRKLEIEGGRARKLDPRLEIDTNAFAKGWAVDRVSAALLALGHADHLVEIGGEVRCRGVKPDGAAWRVGIESPRPGGGLDDAVELRDEALATSGSYRQYFESGGQRVHHIVDPRTGRNAPGRAVSVSVRAADCTLADALATAFMVTGPEGVPRVEAALGAPFAVLFLLHSDGGGVERQEFRWR